MFRGREQSHPERGRALLQRLFEDLQGLAVIESAPLQEGRNMSMMLAPGKAVAQQAHAAEADAAEAALATARAEGEAIEAAPEEGTAPTRPPPFPDQPAAAPMSALKTSPPKPKRRKQPPNPNRRNSRQRTSRRKTSRRPVSRPSARPQSSPRLCRPIGAEAPAVSSLALPGHPGCRRWLRGRAPAGCWCRR